MSFINYSSREIILKIVYYGPGLCGKTTNIKFIYGSTNPDARGKLISLETKAERTLFFDFLPLSLPPQVTTWRLAIEDAARVDQWLNAAKS